MFAAPVVCPDGREDAHLVIADVPQDRRTPPALAPSRVVVGDEGQHAGDGLGEPAVLTTAATLLVGHGFLPDDSPRLHTGAPARGAGERPVAGSAELQLLFFGRRVEDVVAVDQEGLTIGQGETEAKVLCARSPGLARARCYSTCGGRQGGVFQLCARARVTRSMVGSVPTIRAKCRLTSACDGDSRADNA